MRTLSLALRPRSFGQMFGQEQVITAIQRQIASKRMPVAWFFSGETGSGKTSLARIMALSFQCTHAKFGYPCKECRRKRKQFTINEINAAKKNGVEAMNDIAEVSDFAPSPGSEYRVIVLNEVQRISKQAQAILLDYLEEAPETTVWILTTTDPDQILKALRGRCFRLALKSLRGKEIDGFIKWAAKKGGIERSTREIIDEVHRVGITSARSILMSLERYAAGLDPEAAVLVADVDVDTLRVCQNFIKGNFAPIRSELEKANADDARAIRSALMGYLRSIVLNPKSTADKKLICEAIEDLGRIQYIDDTAMSAMLTAVLFRICRKF